VQPAPRLALAWDADERTTVRAAWGRYWQSQGVHELQVADDDETFARAELAEHRVAGVERRFGGGLDARIEAYERRSLRPRARWASADNTLALLPELGPDRRLLTPVDGVARGVELLVRQERATGVSWSAGYALARADERLRQPDGSLRTVPRPLDQRHTLTLDVAYRPSDAWTFGAAFVAHTGWPTTGFEVRADTVGRVILFERVYEPRNASRLPTYHRLDARVTRRFAVAGGRLALFLDVFNAYDRRMRQPDPRGAEAVGGSALREQFDALLPRVPSFGVTFDF
jgi:outer membrane receptor protein involved in Fe transport